MNDSVAVTQLNLYPVKSCRGIKVQRAQLCPYGLLHDREWLVIDDDDQFLTQRKTPRLALIQTQLTKSSLLLAAEGFGELKVSFELEGLENRRVTIWKDSCEALDQGDLVAGWLSDVLQRSARLVRMPTDFKRQIDPKFSSPGEQVSFADGYPLLITTEESLADLNDRLSEPVPMERFRPNVVVTGSAAFTEDSWVEIRVGEITFRVAKPCARCVVTTTDQKTGKRYKEPLRTLATFRRNENGDVIFGQNLIPLEHSGEIRVGDPLKIEQREI